MCEVFKHQTGLKNFYVVGLIAAIIVCCVALLYFHIAMRQEMEETFR